jgi:hypothetical protein
MLTVLKFFLPEINVTDYDIGEHESGTNSLLVPLTSRGDRLMQKKFRLKEDFLKEVLVTR